MMLFTLLLSAPANDPSFKNGLRMVIEGYIGRGFRDLSLKRPYSGPDTTDSARIGCIDK